MEDKMQALILGCGYVGKAFGAALLDRGIGVSGTCRTEAGVGPLSSLGISPVLFDGVASDDLCTFVQQADIILSSIPPTKEGDTAFAALQQALNSGGTKWIGYLSTTGIYGDRDGGWAFEDDVPTPLSIEAKRRVVAEAQWRSLSSSAHVFRLPGIYGPSRSALDQVRAGSARRIDRKAQVFSRAHRSDIVAGLLACVDKPNPGRAYNICDDYPCASGDVIVEACRLLGGAPPPLVPFEKAELSEMGRRFYSECKRVSNARAKAELGWRPTFPTYVEGLADCLVNEVV
jgi:nucleoside-diphosphate-sugar epimerase